MKPNKPLWLGSTLLASLTTLASAQQAEVLFSQEDPFATPMDRSAILAPRFGLTAGDFETVGTTGVMARKYNGDPTTGFADLYSPTISLLGVGANSTNFGGGDILELTYEIYLPAGDIGITGHDAQIRFYNDGGDPGINFGAGSDFAGRVEVPGNFNGVTRQFSLSPIDFDLRDQFQTLTLRTLIPANDGSGQDRPVNALEFGLRMPQAGEIGDPEVPDPNNPGQTMPDPTPNDVEAPVCVYVRNVNLRVIDAPEVPAGTIFSSFDGSGLNAVEMGPTLNARFGLARGGVRSINAMAGEAENIVGDPFLPFSDVYSSAATALDNNTAGIAIRPGDQVRFSYELYIPTPAAGNMLGFNSSRAQIRWYSDIGGNGGNQTQFGMDSEFSRRVETYSPFANLELLDQWQTLTLEATVPANDAGMGNTTFEESASGAPIAGFEFGITLPQAMENNNGMEGGPNGTPENSLEAPVNVFIRNVQLVFPQPDLGDIQPVVTNIDYNPTTDELSLTYTVTPGFTYSVFSAERLQDVTFQLDTLADASGATTFDAVAGDETITTTFVDVEGETLFLRVEGNRTPAAP